MPKLLVQEYLKTKTFGELKREHGVEVSFDQGYYKFALNYSMIESKESDPLAKQCRGLILTTGESMFPVIDRKMNRDAILEMIIPGDTMVLCYPMNRFLNYGQLHADQVNWEDPKLEIQTKLDGSLTNLYFDRIMGQWFVSTRSCTEADIPLSDVCDYTFRTLFEKALAETTNLSFKTFTSQLDKNRTYCFELTTPYNKVVIEHSGCTITLIACRDNLTFEEIHPEDVKGCACVPKIVKLNLRDPKNLVKFVNDQNGLKFEGVVACDSQFRRLKIKNPDYNFYNKSRESLCSSLRNCLSLVLAGKEDDLISALPEDVVLTIQDIKEKLVELIHYYDEQYQILYNAAQQSPETNKDKAFAILVKHSKLWAAPLFDIKRYSYSGMREYLNKRVIEREYPTNSLDSILKEIGYND